MVPGDHRVHEAVFHLEFRPLEPLRKRLADGLLDHPGPGEANKGSRLRQDDIPQGGEAGGNAAGGGVGEYGDIGQALLAEPGQGGAGFRHLHQGEDALLHPGPAAGGEQDQGQAALPGKFNGQRQLFPHGGAHGAKQEAAVQHACHAAAPVDSPHGGDGGFVQAGFAAGGLQLFSVAGEGEGILGGDFGEQFPEGAVIQGDAQAVVGADREVEAALGADKEGPPQIPAADVLPAAGAGGGLPCRDVAFPQGLHGQKPGAASGKNTAHVSSLSARRRENSSSSGR